MKVNPEQEAYMMKHTQGEWDTFKDLAVDVVEEIFDHLQ